jgi:hypothetical protein
MSRASRHADNAAIRLAQANDVRRNEDRDYTLKSAPHRRAEGSWPLRRSFLQQSATVLFHRRSERAGPDLALSSALCFAGVLDRELHEGFAAPEQTFPVCERRLAE